MSSILLQFFSDTFCMSYRFPVALAPPVTIPSALYHGKWQHSFYFSFKWNDTINVIILLSPALVISEAFMENWRRFFLVVSPLLVYLLKFLLNLSMWVTVDNDETKCSSNSTFGFSLFQIHFRFVSLSLLLQHHKGQRFS